MVNLAHIDDPAHTPVITPLGWVCNGHILIRSSDPRRERPYSVKGIAGRLTCQCAGFAYRNTCRHVAQAATHIETHEAHGRGQQTMEAVTRSDPHRQAFRVSAYGSAAWRPVVAQKRGW